MTDTASAETDRVCAKCGQTDADPHHVQYVAFAHPVTGEPTDLTVTKHVDCCAEDGCPICSADVERADQDGVGIKEFVQNPKPEDHMQYLYDNFGIQSADIQAPEEES